MYHTWHIYIHAHDHLSEGDWQHPDVADFGKPCMSSLAAGQFIGQHAQTAPLLRNSRRAT